MKLSNKTIYTLSILAIILLGITVYANTFAVPFIFDDRPNIELNPYIQIDRIDPQSLYIAASKSPCPNRPVANISFALNYYWGQQRVWSYHIVNTLIHLINGILVYFLATLVFSQARKLQSRERSSTPGAAIAWMSLFTALFFITHPLQTNSVTYLVQRMNSLATLFYLLALLLFIKGRLITNRRRRWILFTGCAVAWLLALGSKEIAATLPLIMLLYEWYFFQDLSAKWLKKNSVLLCCGFILVGFIALFYLKGNPLEVILGTYTQRDFTVAERLLTQPRVIVFYISLLFWPHPARLSLLHDFTTSKALTAPLSTSFSLLFICGLIGLSWVLLKKQRLVSFAILWFFINLSIESTFIGLEMVYEHRLYLPMFGFCLILSYSLFSFFATRKPAAAAIATCIVVLLGTATYVRNSDWSDSITFWKDCVEKSPRLARPHNNLGLEYAQRGRLDQAITHYQRAIELRPDLPEAFNNLGSALSRQGRAAQAQEYLHKAIVLKPDYANAYSNLGIVFEQQGRLEDAIRQYKKSLQIDSHNSRAHNNLGIALSRQGHLEEGRRHFKKALEINPDSAQAHKNMGDCLKMMGRMDAAMHHYNSALKLNPAYPDVHNNLGILYARKGRLETARGHFAKAVQLRPEYVQAHNNLGKALVQLGRFAEGIQHFSKAIALRPGFAAAHNNMGIALVKSGRIDTGIVHFQKALELFPGFVNARMNLAAARKLKNSNE